MLEYAEFRRLPLWSQVEVLRKKGTVVAERQHKTWTITLYFLNDHFYERWTNPTLDLITDFKVGAKPMSVVEPYLENIVVQEF